MTDMTTYVGDPSARADIAVIGGSGFSTFFGDEARAVDVFTPFGEPSERILVGEVEGRSVAFLPRHGKGHRHLPHRLNYRANLWALRAIGVRQVIAPCAVGSLVPEQPPGTLVVPDQIIDRTWGRSHTVYDQEGQVVHVGFADPFCARGRSAALQAAAEHGRDVAEAGTVVVINGPRFSTRAEAAWHRAAGGTLVGMTTMPEAVIARELAMCFTSIALVTDLDAGVGPDDAVTHAGVLDVFAEHMDTVKAQVAQTVALLPEPEPDDTASCGCRRALDGITMPFALPT